MDFEAEFDLAESSLSNNENENDNVNCKADKPDNSCKLYSSFTVFINFAIQ